MTQEQARVYEALTKTPQSRKQLTSVTGLSDRALRREISELRKNGYPVCTDSRKGGYWIGEGEDVKRLTKELESRAFDLLETSRRIKRRQLEGQLRMKEV